MFESSQRWAIYNQMRLMQMYNGTEITENTDLSAFWKNLLTNHCHQYLVIYFDDESHIKPDDQTNHKDDSKMYILRIGNSQWGVYEQLISQSKFYFVSDADFLDTRFKNSRLDVFKHVLCKTFSNEVKYLSIYHKGEKNHKD